MMMAFGTWEPYVSLHEKEGSTLIRNAMGLMSAPTYIVAYEPALAQKKRDHRRLHCASHPCSGVEQHARR